jgi:sulfate transport system permease protein
MRYFTKRQSVLPGFTLTLGYTTSYLGLVVIIPLAMLYITTAHLSWEAYLAAIITKRSAAAFLLSFGASFMAAAINLIFGFMIAWVLTRYRFPGKMFIDALVDLPFALPTAVAGITLTTIFSETGCLGRYFYQLGIPSVYSRLGVVIALVFTSIPFVVRSIQPVLANLDPDWEEAGKCLGAPPSQIFRKVIFPEIRPAALTGFALAFARALGEYGSVVFISGNMPLKTEIVPLLIMTKLEEYNYAGATALAVTMLTASFILLLTINFFQKWGQPQPAVNDQQEAVA